MVNLQVIKNVWMLILIKKGYVYKATTIQDS